MTPMIFLITYIIIGVVRSAWLASGLPAYSIDYPKLIFVTVLWPWFLLISIFRALRSW